MIEANHPDLSVRRQCELIKLNRSFLYYKSKKKEHPHKEAMINLIREVHEKHPFYGRPRLLQSLLRAGYKVSSYQVKEMMRETNITALMPFKRLTKSNKQHKKYPYLLKGLEIIRPNQVWATDISYLKYRDSYVYLMAIIDLYSRKILSWGISNTQDTAWCLNILSEALRKYNKPEIFNTDQGSQYTSNAFTALLQANGIRISMDGVGRALDNIFIERFWKSVKYEEFHLHEYSSLKGLKHSIGEYISFYNSDRFHQSLDYKTPDEIYLNFLEVQFVKRKSVVPDSSWIRSTKLMEKLTQEQCVEIFKKCISREDYLKVA